MTVTGFGLIALTVATALLAVPGSADSQPAPRGDYVETYHGVRVPDPYRWMEEMDAEETRRWVEAQDRRARDYAGELPSRATLRDQVEELADVRRYRPPWKRDGRYFYLTFRSSGGPGTTGTQLHVREGLEGGDVTERTLLSQEDLPEGTVLTRIVPGPDGRLVAYGVARDGSRWETLRVFDVERARPLEDRLEGMNTGASAVTWSQDGDGFYYERFEIPAGAEARTARLENERLYYHTVGTGQEEDRVVAAATADDRALTVGLGDDGRWLVVTERDPASGGHRVLVADRRRDETAFHPIVDEASASYRLVGGRGDTLWFETDRDAPNRKVMAVDLGALDVTAAAAAPGSSETETEGAPAWRDVVPEAPEAINTWLGARMVGRYLIVGYLVDARTEWRVFDLEGRPLHTLELPRLGSVWSGFLPSAGLEETETFYSLSGLADPGSIYRLDLETGRSTRFARPELGHDPDEFVTRQVFYEGGDGTRVPMYLVHRRGLERDGRAPVIMYGYGFGGWSAEPWFQPHLAAWLRMGGAWALPNIRGGGEYGEAWHRAGSGRDKQTGIDDYVAAAEWLIEDGLTSPGRLVLNASSAGGAVGGAALVQRPDLFGAAILDYPVLDLLRYDQFTGGARWRSAFGTAEDPEDFAALLGYSPYHTIGLHRCYPPTLVSPGELDEVTPPLHAYKFTAALQRAQGCDEPILLRVTWGAGHSSGATVEDAVETWTDQLSFLVRVLGERGWQPTGSAGVAARHLASPVVGPNDSTPTVQHALRQTAPSPVAITDVNVVPMDTPRVLGGRTVVVRDGMIAAMGANGTVEIPENAVRVDGDGGYLLPGLVDSHVHLRSERELISYLAHGVTTIVNLSGTTEDAPEPLRTRARIARGELVGPSLYTTGPVLDGDPPIFGAVSTVVETPDEARRTVAAQAEAGYDFIKVYNNLRPDVLRAAIAEAHARDLAVFGHIPRRGGRERALQRALDAGLDVIAHGEEYFFTFFHAGIDSLLDRGEIPHRDPSRIPEAVRLTRRAGAAVVPNLSFIAMTRRQLDSLQVVTTHPEMRYLSPGVREMWDRYNPTRRPNLARFDRRERAKYPFVRKLAKAFHDEGVPLMLGTDASGPGLFPGLSAHLELQELVAAGLSPYEALVAGTRTAGRFIHRHAPSSAPFGVVAPGHRADLLLVRDNPLEDIGHVTAVEGVMVRGEWMSKTELERLRDGLSALVTEDVEDSNHGPTPEAALPPPEIEILGEGTVSTAAPEFGASLTPDGRTLYFNRASADRQELRIMVARRTGDDWGAPRVASFSGTHRDLDAFVAPDGDRVWFNSDRPAPGGESGGFDVWYVDRADDGWGAPVRPPPPLNSDSVEMFVSATREGDLYFTSTRDGPLRAYRATPRPGGWNEPEAVSVRPEPRNPLIGPDGSFLVFTASGPDGSTDLFVTCRRDGGWGEPIHLPRPINSPYTDFAPGLDPADRSLLFTSERPGMAGPQPDSVRPPGDLYRSSLRPAELCRGTPGADEL